ncbi:uncharacterized protein LOC141912774 isoform X2 [Tubulanus polymorphus]|uniref:uncharacterized protein LOC141912774 isoform X2 n=1 Tax=Tubulanus polymorphus TaxID=672921 RepID=UPI003DA360F5
MKAESQSPKISREAETDLVDDSEDLNDERCCTEDNPKSIAEWDARTGYEEIVGSTCDAISDESSYPVADSETSIRSLRKINNNNNNDEDDENSYYYQKQLLQEHEKTYITLESRKIKQEIVSDDYSHASPESGFDPNNFQPDLWTDSQVIGFLYHVGKQMGWNMKGFLGENFQGVSGLQLFQMTEVEMISREPRYGALMYKFISDFFKGKSSSDCSYTYTSADESSQTSPSSFSNTCDYSKLSEEPISVLINGHKYDFDADPNSLNQPFTGHFFSCIGGGAAEHQRHLYEYEQKFDPRSIEGQYHHHSYQQHQQHQHQQHQHQQQQQQQHQQRASLPSFTSTYQPILSREFAPRFMDDRMDDRCGDAIYDGLYVDSDVLPLVPETVSKRCRRGSTGSSSKESMYGDHIPTSKKKPSNRGRKPGKGNHLWEFIRDLLGNPDFNPKIIKWEDLSAGVFRIVQSQKVAEMWGRKKKNSNMNYEKLSRALRYYYDRDVLRRVGGKRLVFQFGDKARDWRPAISPSGGHEVESYFHYRPIHPV